MARNGGEQQPAGQPEPSESLDPFDDETEPIAWYRRPVGLIVWGLSVLVLIALIVFGIIELIHDQGTSNTPGTTSTTPSTTTSTTTNTTTTTTSTTTTTTTTTPTTSSSVAPPPPEPTNTQQQPSHRHHLPSWLRSLVPGLS